MRPSYNNQRGSALVLVVVLSVAILIGVGIAIRVATEKNEQAKAEDYVRNLREANQATGKRIKLELARDLAEGKKVIPLETAALQEYLQGRLDNNKAVTPDFSKLQGQTITLEDTPTAPTQFSESNDPIRYALGSHTGVTVPEYWLNIGFGEKEAFKGYQVKSDMQLLRRFVGAENYAWIHYGAHSLDISTWRHPLRLALPQYLPSDMTGMTRADLVSTMGFRSSSFYVTSDFATATGLGHMEAATFKPVFFKNKLRVMPPMDITWLDETLGMDMEEELGSTQLNAFSSASPVTLTSLSSSGDTLEARRTQASQMNWLKKYLFTQADLNTDSALVFLPLTENKNAGVFSESSPNDFWDASKSAAAYGYRPSEATTVWANFSYNSSTDSLALDVFKRGAGAEGGTVALTDEERLHITVDGNVYYPNQKEFWNSAWYTIASAVGIDGVTIPEGTALGTFSYPEAAQDILRWQNEFASPTWKDELLQTLTTEDKLVGVVKASYFKGAVRLQRFDKIGSVFPDYAVVVDPSRSESLPENTFKGKASKGVFVDVNTASIPNGLTDSRKKELLLRLLNGALVIPASEQVGSVLRRTLEGAVVPIADSRYTAAFASSDKETTFTFATNGRITFDGYINVNTGVSLDANAAIQPQGDPIGPDNLVSLTAALGDNYFSVDQAVVEARTDGGINRSVFASRLRPAFTFLQAGDAPTNLNLDSGPRSDPMDPNVPNLTLLNEAVDTTVGEGGVLPLQLIQTAILDDAYNDIAAALRDQSTMRRAVRDGVESVALGGGLDAYNPTLDSAITTDLTNYVNEALPSILTADPDLTSGIIRARLLATKPPALTALIPGLQSLLVYNAGRYEDAGFSKVYFQRYGWNIEADDSFEAKATYRFRPVFSGNVMQQIWRYCRDLGNAGEGDRRYVEDPYPIDDNLFKNSNGVPRDRSYYLDEVYAQASTSNAVIVAPTGEERNFAFSGCPYPSLLEVDVSKAYNPAKGKRIDGSTNLEPTTMLKAFFYPMVDLSPQGPADVQQVLNSVFREENPLSIPAAIEGSTRLPLERARYVVSVNNKFTAMLEAKADQLLAQNGFTYGTLDSAWSDIASLSPFFGVVEYTLAHTQRKDPTTLAATLPPLPQAPLVALWHTQEDRLKLARVRIWENPGETLPISSTQVTTLPFDADAIAPNIEGLTVDEQTLIASELDAMALPAFRDKVTELLSENGANALPSPTGGRFAVKLGSNVSDWVPSNTSAAQLQGALTAIGVNASVTGTAGGPFRIAYNNVGPVTTQFSFINELQPIGKVNIELVRAIAGTSTKPEILRLSVYKQPFLQDCLPQTRVEIAENEVQGGIYGFMTFFASADTTSPGLTYPNNGPTSSYLYYKPVVGHSKDMTTGQPLFSGSIAREINVGFTADSQPYAPTYNVTPKDNSPVRVRDMVEVKRTRTVTSARIYRFLTISELQGAFSDYSALRVNVGGNNADKGTELLSSTVVEALTKRKITFELYKRARFKDEGNLTTLPKVAFAGVGTLITAADSPHPVVLSNARLVLGSRSTAVVGWSGGIRTGVGSDIDATMQALAPNAFVSEPDTAITYIYGDPMLTSREWGTIGLSSEQTTSTDKGKVERKR